MYKQGRKRPLDTPERMRETVMTETQRNMIEKERKSKRRFLLLFLVKSPERRNKA